MHDMPKDLSPPSELQLRWCSNCGRTGWSVIDLGSSHAYEAGVASPYFCEGPVKTIIYKAIESHD